MHCQEEEPPVKITKKQQLASKAAAADAEGTEGGGRGRGRGRGRGQKKPAEPETKTSKTLKKTKKDPTKEVDRIAGYTMEEWDEWWAKQEAQNEKNDQEEKPTRRKGRKTEPSASSKPEKPNKRNQSKDTEGHSAKKKKTEKESNDTKEKKSSAKDSKDVQKEPKKKAKKPEKQEELMPSPGTKKEMKSEIFEFLVKSKDFTDDDAKEKLQEMMPNYQNCGVDCRLDTYWKRKNTMGVGVGVFSKGEQKNVGFFGFRTLTDNWIYAIAAAIKAGDILATLMHIRPDSLYQNCRITKSFFLVLSIFEINTV